MPVKGKKKQSLNAETILTKVTEYDVYRFYVGQDFYIGKAFLSPFHKENNPSFVVMCTKDGELHHLDFSGGFKGNCFEFVMQLYCINFDQALRKIDQDMGLQIAYSSNLDHKTVVRCFAKPDRPEPKKTIIQVKSRKFDPSDLAYWKLYGITEEELKSNNVYAVGKLYLNKKLFPLPATELVFGYLFDDKWKIYRPLADKKHKWMTNVPTDVMGGLHRMKPGTERGFITKAKKDEIVLAKFLPAVCSTQNESQFSINSANLRLLKENCKELYLNFDADEVGVQASKYYNQFGFSWVNCPRGYTKPDGTIIKDFADLARYYGLDTVINHFKSKKLI